MIKSFSDFWYVDSFRRYSRSKSKVAIIAKNFGRFFGRHKFKGTSIVKIVPNLSPLPCGVSNEKKSNEDSPTNPEVIESNTLNFRPDF